ncbi:MAG: hypothetical protein H0T62_14100 [Parachlamydiaceae bacterium]|nr:hypothetical protein [Parachlamydiaceae bacterium]
MSTIGFYEPVYIVPLPKTAANTPAIIWTPIIDNSFFQFRFNKARWKEGWDTTCIRIVNTAEFIFDFATVESFFDFDKNKKSAAYSITPQMIGKPRSIYNYDGDNSRGWKVLQIISIVALVILFPIGIPLAIALFCIKDHHREKVDPFARDEEKNLAIKTNEARDNSLSDPIKYHLDVYACYLKDVILQRFEIPENKFSKSFDDIENCRINVAASFKEIENCKKTIATSLEEIVRCENEIATQEKETRAAISVKKEPVKKGTLQNIGKNRRPPVIPTKKKIDPQVTIDELIRKIEELETTIGEREEEIHFTISGLKERIFVSLKNAIANKMGEKLIKINDSTLNLKNSEIKAEQSKILKTSKENKAELLALRTIFSQLLEGESQLDILKEEPKAQLNILGEEPKASKQLERVCSEHEQLLNQTIEIIDQILKEEENVAIDLAKTLFGNELIKQGGKLVRIPKNGSCLFLSLVHSKELKANKEMWNNEASILRKGLVQSLREKLENALPLGGEGFMEDPGFILKSKIQLEMDDRNHLAGYPEDFKKKIQKGGASFIESEKNGEGWRAYLDSLEKETTFAGQIELSELPELLQANIHVYVPKLNEVPIIRDEDGRLYVFCPKFADENCKDYVFSREDRINWVESHKTEGKILPTYSIPEEQSYDHDIHVILRKNHYDLYLPDQS